MTPTRRTVLATGLLAASGLASAPRRAAAQAVPELRLGVGTAAEENLWLMEARPDLTPNQGKAYKLAVTRFPATDRRFQAFEAGGLDIATGSSHSVSVALSEGSEMRIIASLCRESPQGFVNQYYVLNNSPLRSLADLRGKTIGINGIGASTHLWAKLALARVGIDADKDVTFLPVRFPAMGEALRAGKIDVGAFPQPFAQTEEDQGGVRSLFTSKDASPYEEELMLVVASPKLLAERPAAVRAFLSDLVGATRFYLEHGDEARRALITARIVRMRPEDYVRMRDYYREPNARPSRESMEQIQDALIRAGFQRNRVDYARVIDTSFLPQS